MNWLDQTKTWSKYRDFWTSLGVVICYLYVWETGICPQRRWSNSRWWTPLTWRWDRRQTWNLHAPLITDYWTTYRSSQDWRARSSWSRSDRSHEIRTWTRKSIFSGQHVNRLWKLDASRGISRKKHQRKRWTGTILVPITRRNMRKRDRTCRASCEWWKSLSRCPFMLCVNVVCVTGWMHGIFMTV